MLDYIRAEPLKRISVERVGHDYDVRKLSTRLIDLRVVNLRYVDGAFVEYRGLLGGKYLKEKQKLIEAELSSKLLFEELNLRSKCTFQLDG